MLILGTRLQLGRNASLSPFDKVAISPKRAFGLQSAGMMQSVQNDAEDILSLMARYRVSRNQLRRN
jgi:hypothetical protein